MLHQSMRVAVLLFMTDAEIQVHLRCNTSIALGKQKLNIDWRIFSKARYKWSGQTISLQLVAMNKCYASDEYYIKHAFAAWFSEAEQNGARYGWMDAIDHYPKDDR